MGCKHKAYHIINSDPGDKAAFGWKFENNFWQSLKSTDEKVKEKKQEVGELRICLRENDNKLKTFS